MQPVKQSYRDSKTGIPEPVFVAMGWGIAAWLRELCDALVERHLALFEDYDAPGCIKSSL